MDNYDGQPKQEALLPESVFSGTRLINVPKLIKEITIILAIIYSVSAAYSQNDGGGYAESYLLRDVGARAISMAGAYTAIANEPSAIFYNPAGLGFFNNQPSVMTMLTPMDLGRSQQAIAWGQSLFENFGIGIGFNSFYGGSFTARDVKGNIRGDYSAWSYEFLGAASYSIEFASVGFALKYLTDNLVGSQTYANGYSMDIGMKFNVMDMFSFGISVKDFAGMMFWNTLEKTAESLPFSIRTGLAMEFALNQDSYQTRTNEEGELITEYIPSTRFILVSMDAVYNQNEMSPKIVLGAEATLHEMVIFRAGIGLYGERDGIPQLFPMNTWGAGVSFRPKLQELPFDVHIDYSVSNDKIAEVGLAHHISFMFEF
ncbi:MAG: PorV/PorQ family protein [Bacteroidota bacterium]|nr:PorV/PorQ family protein [Bacteroidota bacterium]